MSQTKVTSNDFVPEVIEKMKQRGVEGVTYEVKDFLDTGYEANSFDVIIDKGSFDAICLNSDKDSE